MDALSAVEVAPGDPRLTDLIARHLAFARASSPPKSVHAMNAADLAADVLHMVAIFDGEAAVAMGALRRIALTDGELKSMHVLAGHRGQGHADAVLSRLLDLARKAGMNRVFLETGGAEVFCAARGFYRRHGFKVTTPFADYVEDPESVFMTRTI